MLIAANLNNSLVTAGTFRQKQPMVSNFSNLNNKFTNPYSLSLYPNKTASIYKPSSKNDGVTHTSWFYVNDVHGKMTNMERIYHISQDFDRIPAQELTKNFFKQNDEITKFKVASGDIILGANYVHNNVANHFMNWSGFEACALGNHELDVENSKDLSKLWKDANYKMLAVNIDVNKDSPLFNLIQKSTIIEKDGEKYGLIGLAPNDMKERVKMNNTLSDVSVCDLDISIKRVQEEVNKIKAQGINKIILLSHGGAKADKRIATETEGIDLIFGAHTHDLVNDIKEGENLLYSKTGEPVIITQAGKDGENLGVLNIDFNKEGIVTRAQNNVIRTRAFNRPLYIKDSVENILGKPQVIGYVDKAVPPPSKRLIENNPHGNVIVDAMKNELNTEIAILNTGNIRGRFAPGPIDTRLLSDITPFEDKMMIIELTEKQIVDAIKIGCNSITKTSNKPGILLVSGLNYKANTKGQLLELNYVDKNNIVHPIDVNNPDANRKYTVAVDDFFATGGDGYLETNKNPNFVLKVFDLDKNKLACDYIQKMKQPIEIKNDDRIQIVP